MRVEAMQAAGHRLLWVEDPILRDDFDGLRMLRARDDGDAAQLGRVPRPVGRRALLEARATDMLNVHGRVGEVMQLGWLAADIGIPVTLGNTFLEMGVHVAVALPEVQWMEYSFQNYDHPRRGAHRDPGRLGPSRPTAPATAWVCQQGGAPRLGAP